MRYHWASPALQPGASLVSGGSCPRPAKCSEKLGLALSSWDGEVQQQAYCHRLPYCRNIPLVGGLEHEFYDFPYIGNVIIPTDELHHFSEG